MKFDLKNYALWTAIVTPLKEDQSLDLEGFKILLKEQEEAGNGILILGSTGESLNLTSEEKLKVLDFTLEQNLGVPIMVGVGGNEIKGTRDWVRHLGTKDGVHSLLMVTPLYAKPETEGQYEWFKTLMDEAKQPVMLYNVPGRTGKALSFDALKRLNKHPKFWAVKEASGSVDEFKKYVEASGDGLVYSGDDGMVPAFAPHGCHGLVSVASNAWPKETGEYVRQSLKGELSDKDASLWDACSAALFCVSNPIPVKRLLSEEKRIAGPYLRLPLTHKDLNQGVTVLEASTRIQEWYKELKK